MFGLYVSSAVLLLLDVCAGKKLYNARGRVLTEEIDDTTADSDKLTESTDASPIYTRDETHQHHPSSACSAILCVLVGPFRPHKSWFTFSCLKSALGRLPYISPLSFDPRSDFHLRQST